MKEYPTMPLDVLNDPNSKYAPNFHRVDNAAICYFCKFNEYVGAEEFKCVKHNISFGHKTALQAEFTCDNWIVDK
jgi:hypothetical protein